MSVLLSSLQTQGVGIPTKIISVALFVLTVGVYDAAFAFGTINGLGQSSEHGKITRLALRPFSIGPKTMSELAGSRGRFGAVGAPDHPKRGIHNKSVAHCSAADHMPAPGYPQGRITAAAKLGECRVWIFQHLRRAVSEAGKLVQPDGRIRTSQIPTILPCVYTGGSGRAKCNAMGALGLAFHAAQDFYSHSNWSDMPRTGRIHTGNPPGLGNATRALWLDPRLKLKMPAGLISGCFQGFPEKRYCIGRVRHADLNKDTGRINVARGSVGAGTTKRGRINNNFAWAAKAAISDTRDKWAYFEEQVILRYGQRRGRKIICVMRQDRSKGC